MIDDDNRTFNSSSEASAKLSPLEASDYRAKFWSKCPYIYDGKLLWL